MQARQRSFMLLPDWSYTPGGPVALGRIVPIDKKTKLPSPENAFNQNIGIDLPADRVNTQTITSWKHDTDDTTSLNGGVTADLSLFTGLGAGVKGNTSRQDGFNITSQQVKRMTFFPTPAELAQVVAIPLVKAILSKMTNATVWMVTGLMVADGAEIVEKTGRGLGVGPHASADFTSLGAPVNVGVNTEWSHSKTGNTTQKIQGELLVGYQLLRIRRRVLRSVETEKETRFALYDDDAANELEDYDFDLVAPLEDQEAGLI